MFGMGVGVMLLGLVMMLVVLALIVLGVIWVVRAYGQGTRSQSPRDESKDDAGR